MIHRIVGCVEGILSYFFIPLKHSTQVVLRSLNVSGYCPSEDVEKYHRFKASVDNGVVIFNHPTYFDHVVIMKELNDTPRFVMFKEYMKGPFRWIANKVNAIGIDKKTKGSSTVVSQAIQNRRATEPLVILSPAAGKCSHTRPWFIYPFRTGAFITKPIVLPIILYYTPYESNHDDLKGSILKRLTGEPMQYVMRVLDPIEPMQSETTRQFADRCRRIH
jgi:1-acyl-sn-glycerol-3-phosphate acyltransferase